MSRLFDRRQAWTLLAALWLAAQTVGVAHAADATLHADGVDCHVCQHFDRFGMVADVETPIQPVSEWVATAPIGREISPTRCIVAPPPARAPPSLSRR